MRQEIIVASLQRRLRQPANLLLVGLVGGMFGIFRLLARDHPPSALELALPFLLLLAHVALAPIPWQWTPEEEPRAGLFRGFLRAFAFNALWIGAVLVAMHGAAPLERPNRPLPPPPPGEMEPSGPPRPIPPPRSGPPPFLPGMGLGLLNLAFALVYGWTTAEKEAMELRERRTADLLRQSQSKALQNQLEPHVLYNALSSLSELVYEDPLAAEDVITRLADLYRMLTTHGKASETLLAEERRLVEAYLAMEQMRLGERLRVSWEWPEWADGIRMPPFFLQPLVENAIKHGISPSDRGGELRISACREGDEILLRVANTGRPPSENPARGVGLGNLESRLALWNQGPGAFTLRQEGEWTVAAVRWIARSSG